jgi:hypothetical protein
MSAEYTDIELRRALNRLRDDMADAVYKALTAAPKPWTDDAIPVLAKAIRKTCTPDRIAAAAAGMTPEALRAFEHDLYEALRRDPTLPPLPPIEEET